jgi:hypothetical protein
MLCTDVASENHDFGHSFAKRATNRAGPSSPVEIRENLQLHDSPAVPTPSNLFRDHAPLPEQQKPRSAVSRPASAP